MHWGSSYDWEFAGVLRPPWTPGAFFSTVVAAMSGTFAEIKRDLMPSERAWVVEVVLRAWREVAVRAAPTPTVSVYWYGKPWGQTPDHLRIHLSFPPEALLP